MTAFIRNPARARGARRMRLAAPPLCALIGAGLLALCTASSAVAYELEPGVNTAGVIEFPTANDQYFPHTVAGTLEIFDIGAPELAVENLRYGWQAGAFQLVTDIFMLTEPKKEFDQAIVRAKLRILRFEPERTSVALGALARIVTDEEGEERIDNKPYSLMGIVTTELFPFRDWGGILVNAYLDNRVFVAGLKVQIYRFIKGVGEWDYYHTSDVSDRELGKGGIEIEGETDFYFQLFWAERSDNVFAQVGVGF